jgi:Uncharacterised nucleotidyltransferase
MSRSNMMEKDIRFLVADLALGRSIPKGCCRCWTASYIQAALFHGLAPWLYYSLRSLPEVELNPRFMKELQMHFYLSIKSSASLETALKQLLVSLNEAAIKVVLLKGVHLAHFIYDDPALRIMNDIDIAVAPDDFKRVADLLVGLGFEKCQYLSDASNPLPEPSFGYSRAGGSSVPVDLHRELRSMNYYRISWPTISHEAKETKALGLPCYVMSRELNFIHLALHSLNHGHLLRDWLDMILVSSHPTFDWDRLLSLALSLGVQRPLRWVLGRLAREWKLEPPRHVDADLTTSRAHWLEDRIIAGRCRYLWRVVAGVILVPGWRSRARYALTRIFPPASYVESACGTTSWLAYINSKIRHLHHLATR